MEEDQYTEERIPCSICGRSFAPEVLTKHSNVCKKSAATATKRKPFDSSKQRVLEGELSLKQIKEAQKKLRMLCDKGARNLHWPAVLQEILDLKPDTSPDITEADREIRELEFAVNLDNALLCQVTAKLRNDQGCSARELKPPKSHWREKHQDFINAVRNARDLQQAISSGGPLPPPPPPSVNPDYVSCPHCSRRFNQSAAERHISFCKDKQSKLPKDKPGSSTSSAKQNSRVNYQPLKPKAKTSNTVPSSTSAPASSSTAPARPALTAAKAPLKAPTSTAKTSTGGQTSLARNSTVGSTSSTRQTSLAKVPTGGSASTSRIAAGGSASATRITTGGSASATRITPGNTAASTKLSAGGPASSTHIPAGEVTSSAKKAIGGFASASRIPSGSSSSTKIPSGNAAPSTKIPVGAAPSSRIPVGGAASTTRIPVGGIARGKAAPVAKEEEPVTLTMDKIITKERHKTAEPTIYKIISKLSLVTKSDFSVSVDKPETGLLHSGDSDTNRPDFRRVLSEKSVNKKWNLHKKQKLHAKSKSYFSEEDVVSTHVPLPLNESKASVHYLRDVKHKAADPGMKTTPEMCNLHVEVNRIPEDHPYQQQHHLQQLLLDQEPPRMKTTPEMCNQHVEVDRIPEDHLSRHHHHAYLQQLLLDSEPLRMKTIPEMCNLPVKVDRISPEDHSFQHHHHAYMQQLLLDSEPLRMKTTSEICNLHVEVDRKPEDQSSQHHHHLQQLSLDQEPPRMKTTPEMHLHVEVDRNPKDHPSQHHHHEYLQQLLLDPEPLLGPTQLLPDIQLHRQPHQAGPANNYFHRYSSFYEVLSTDSKTDNNYLGVKNSFTKVNNRLTKSLTTPLALNYFHNLDDPYRDTNVFSSARSSDKFNFTEAKFCCNCGLRFPVSSANFCCHCGVRRGKVTDRDFRCHF